MAEDAAAAVDVVDEEMMRTLRSKSCLRRCSRRVGEETNLCCAQIFVRNLPAEYTDERALKDFGEFGTVEKHKLADRLVMLPANLS